ncbi:hypothetical protein ACU5EH_23800 [Aliivibrio salmonicida]
MHIIFFNTKGGVSKSTLCEFTTRELKRLGHGVQLTIPTNKSTSH